MRKILSFLATLVAFAFAFVSALLLLIPLVVMAVFGIVSIIPTVLSVWFDFASEGKWNFWWDRAKWEFGKIIKRIKDDFKVR